MYWLTSFMGIFVLKALVVEKIKSVFRDVK